MSRRSCKKVCVCVCVCLCVCVRKCVHGAKVRVCACSCESCWGFAIYQDDIEDLEEGLADDKKFLAELQKSCSTKDNR